MAKIIVVSHYTKSLINFRGDLIKSISKLGHDVIALGPEKGYENELKKLGAEFIQIPLDRTGGNPAKDLKTLLSLIKVINKIEPDIVLSYAIKPVIYGSLAARILKVEAVYSMITGLGYVFTRDKGKEGILKKVVKILYKEALKNNKAVFFQNPDDMEFFRSEKILDNRTQAVLINGSGVNIDRFYYVSPPIKPLSFLLIARLIWDKGIGVYVEAARKLKSRHPEVSFKLLGPFDSNPAAIKKNDVEKWISEGIIEYLGETEDVRPYIANSSVYVLPSYYREGTPRSILEAMAMGRPIITTNAPGCKETVKEGVNGFLVPTKDPYSLARAMEKFIQNPDLIISMGKESRKIAEMKYDVNTVNNIILKTMSLI
ncbi:glycosyltransferase family 4 protein [Thermovenabulum sp.]|uniref:glycosyltransferase family 4 protein n=1 Tax=Thermovenabulum sp. TaxID=3100335 RepID=UPI003C7CF5C4